MKNRIPEMKKHFSDSHLGVFKDLGGYYWIAGGAVRDFFLKKTPKDIDFYFSSPSERDEASKFLVSKMGFKYLEGWRKHGPSGVRGHDRFEKDNLKYELFFTQPDPIKAINEFDYTVCACAIDCNLNFFRHQDFFEDLSQKKLSKIEPTLIEYASSSIREMTRLLKFLEHGYHIDKENLVLWLKKTIKIDNYHSQKWIRINSLYEQD